MAVGARYRGSACREHPKHFARKLESLDYVPVHLWSAFGCEVLEMEPAHYAPVWSVANTRRCSVRILTSSKRPRLIDGVI